MRALTLAAALAAFTLIPASARAQQVSAVIVIGNPPVHSPVYRESYRPVRRVYVAPAPRVIYVQQVHRRHDHRRYRTTRAFYDYHRNVYYDRYRPGLREVVIYVHGNDYYRFDDDYGYRSDDRYRRDDRYRHDDRYRNDDRYDYDD
jgi:hypothetical protein